MYSLWERMNLDFLSLLPVCNSFFFLSYVFPMGQKVKKNQNGWRSAWPWESCSARINWDLRRRRGDECVVIHSLGSGCPGRLEGNDNRNYYYHMECLFSIGKYLVERLSSHIPIWYKIWNPIYRVVNSWKSQTGVLGDSLYICDGF